MNEMQLFEKINKIKLNINDSLLSISLLKEKLLNISKKRKFDDREIKLIKENKVFQVKEDEYLNEINQLNRKINEVNDKYNECLKSKDELSKINSQNQMHIEDLLKEIHLLKLKKEDHDQEKERQKEIKILSETVKKMNKEYLISLYKK